MRSLLVLLAVSFFYACHAAQPQPVQAIIFDFGNVIAKPDTALVIDFLATSSRVSREQAEEFLQNLWEHQKQGGNEKSFIAQHGSAYPWNRFKERFWRRQWSRAKAISIKEIPGMLDLVTALQQKGFITPLFSNVTSGKEWEESVHKAGYFDFFKPLFLSHKMGVSKPDPAAFEFVLKELALPAEGCLFVDDRLENVEAAKGLGIDVIQFVDRAQLIQALKTRGIDV